MTVSFESGCRIAILNANVFEDCPSLKSVFIPVSLERGCRMSLRDRRESAVCVFESDYPLLLDAGGSGLKSSTIARSAGTLPDSEFDEGYRRAWDDFLMPA
jgi:hypothetical protein